MTNKRVEKEQIVNINRTVKGYYKASIMEADENGNIDESFTTGWRNNTILNCGMDKVAYMPWAQTFQFCLIGDYPYGPSDPLTASLSEKMLKRPRRMHNFYLTGEGNCGHKLSGSVLRLYRTFDFYKENQNTTYTELGFKETPAASTLFSKIRLDPPITLHAGQFLRVNYELRVNMSPATGSAGGVAPVNYPQFTGWSTGSLDREAIQKLGMCGIDSGSGMAMPIDEAGFCNEPFAPGQLSFGPGFGFVNRYFNGSRVNYFPTASGDTSYERNPFKAVGPLQEYVSPYQNPFQVIDYGISASLSVDGGRHSGSFCVPNISKFYPRNYFTTDFIYKAAEKLNVFDQIVWNLNPRTGTAEGQLTNTLGIYYVTQAVSTGVISNDYTWYIKQGIDLTTQIFYTPTTSGNDGNRFEYFDSFWTPYCKIGTLSSTGATPLFYSNNNNSNFFNDFYYDPSLQNSGSLSYPRFPGGIAYPGSAVTASKYEIPYTAGSKGLTKLQSEANVQGKVLPAKFPYYDDWNAYQSTSSIVNLPPYVKRLGWTGSPDSDLSGTKLGTNWYVRGSSCFLSTHTGSAAVFTASVDRSPSTTRKVYSVELPMYIVPYTGSSNPYNYFRDKVVVFSNATANNIDIPSSYRPDPNVAPAWKTIGIGPTSLNLYPTNMNDASKYNGYVYCLSTGSFKSKDYSLKLVFRYSWARG